MNIRLIIGSILIFSISACTASTNANSHGTVAQSTTDPADDFVMQTIIAREQLLTETLTPTPTELTNLPEPWAELITSTPIPTVQPPSAHTLTIATALRPNSIIYQGPGTNYRMACYVQKGSQLTVIGQNSDSSWLRIELYQGQTCVTMVGNIIREDVRRDPNSQFWILSSSYTISGDLSRVPIITR